MPRLSNLVINGAGLVPQRWHELTFVLISTYNFRMADTTETTAIPLCKVFVTNLYRIMDERDLSVLGMANALGYGSRTYLTRILNGSCSPSLDQVDRFAEKLGCTPIDLLQAD